MDADGSQNGARDTWQIAITILGGAAGLGLFLVALGTSVMWIRLDAVGLPTERGVAVISKQTLAVVGMHKLVEPLLLSTGVVTALFLLLSRKGGTSSATLQLGRAALDAGFRRKLRWYCVAGLLVACAVELFAPFSWAFAAWSAGIACPIAAAYVAGIRGHNVRVPQLRRGAFIYVAVLVTVAALATEGDAPSILENATVTLKRGGTAYGYFISEDSSAVYLGIRESIFAVSHEEVINVRVTSAPHTTLYHDHPSLVEKAADAIFD